MRKATAGWLIGAGAGLVLAWLFRDRLARILDAPAEIVVDTGGDGKPHVSFVTAEVTVKKHKHVKWQVTNRSNADVLIELADWRDANRKPVPQAVDADPDDHEHPPQRGLSREVPAKPNEKRPIRGKARPPLDGNCETVKYAVYLDKQLAVDPIVKLIV